MLCTRAGLGDPYQAMGNIKILPIEGKQRFHSGFVRGLAFLNEIGAVTVSRLSMLALCRQPHHFENVYLALLLYNPSTDHARTFPITALAQPCRVICSGCTDLSPNPLTSSIGTGHPFQKRLKQPHPYTRT